MIWVILSKLFLRNIYFADTLEALERGGMVKDYNSNSTNLDSEDEEDPRTPASVSSQVMIDDFAMENQTTSSLLAIQHVLIPNAINQVWETVLSI